jgi:transposase
MNIKVRKKYSQEFKHDAVKLVTEQGYRVSEASRNLDVRENEGSTLYSPFSIQGEMVRSEMNSLTKYIQ